MPYQPATPLFSLLRKLAALPAAASGEPEPAPCLRLHRHRCSSARMASR